MFPKKSSILFNQVNPGDTGGGGANAQTTPQVPPPAQSAPTPQAQGGIEYDELGYAKIPAQQPPAPNQTPQANQPPAATPPAPVAEVNSGYNTPPPPPNASGYVDPNAAPPAAPTLPATPPPPAPGEFKVEVDLKDFNDVDKKLFTENFEKYKLPKEAQQALVDIRKNYIQQQTVEQANYQKELDAQILKTKTDWFNELKNDKDFGGANFDANTKMVNKFINDFMPNTKKMLTEKGGMLPPNTMRDFHAVAKKLYETEGFVQGDGSAASETKPTDQWKFLSDMYVNN